MQLHPEVVLLDVQLPDATGFEVAAELALMNGSAPQVVLVSSRDASDYGDLIPACGARGFVAKGELSGAAFRPLAALEPARGRVLFRRRRSWSPRWSGRSS